MTIESARAAHEKVFVDSCTIVDDIEGPYDKTLNTATGVLEGGPADAAVYSGRCWVRTFSGQRLSFLEVGEQQLASEYYRLTLPWEGTAGVKPGQTVTVTGSPDSSLVGKTFVVQNVANGDYEPSRRVDMEDRTDAFRNR